MISADKLKIYCRFPIVRIVDLDMEVKEGSHGKLILRGFLSNMLEDVPLDNETIKITGQNSDKYEQEEILFCGIIQETYIFVENGVKQVILSASTVDIKMDKKKGSRSFQKVSETYGEIISDITAKYQGTTACDKTEKLVNPVLQYEETDWEFCRRMASYMGLGIFCNPCSTNPQISLGFVNEEVKADFPSDAYSVFIDEAYYHKGLKGTLKADFVYYQVKSWENYGIGSSAYYKGQKRYIFEKRAELCNGVLVFCYKLGGKCHFTKQKLQNKQIAGLSLAGTVKRTDGQSVYMKLDIDGAEGKADYPYLWTPVIGNMMYCMPQTGTRAYLYFADCNEGSAAAVNSIRSGAECPEFGNSQNRGILTEHGKQMQLYADSIFFKGGKEGSEQKFSMEEAGCMFRAGAGKLVVTGGAGITLNAPVIRIRTPQEINQYKMKDYALQKSGEIIPKGSRNPATGGDTGFSLQYEFNGMAGQGVLAGTEYERYIPFADAPEYEEVEEIPLWLKILAGAAVALLVGAVVGALVFFAAPVLLAASATTAVVLGVAAGAVTAGVGIAAAVGTAKADEKNGTSSSLGDYMLNSLSASTIVGGSVIALMLMPSAGEMLASMAFGPGAAGLTLFGTPITVCGLASAGTVGVGTLNLGFQLNDVSMFATGQKSLGAPTGDQIYDGIKQATGWTTLGLAFLGLFNPRIYEGLNGTMDIRGEAGYQNPAESGTATLGDTFGKMGEYVKSPGIKVDWSQYAQHGFDRLAQRGMSKELVESIVQNGKALSQNGGAKFAFVTEQGVVVLSKEGKLVTAWSSAYFDDAMKEIIKLLFGS